MTHHRRLPITILKKRYSQKLHPIPSLSWKLMIKRYPSVNISNMSLDADKLTIHFPPLLTINPLLFSPFTCMKISCCDCSRWCQLYRWTLVIATAENNALLKSYRTTKGREIYNFIFMLFQQHNFIMFNYIMITQAI